MTSQATGEPWCGACKQRWARCSGCGRRGPRPRRHQSPSRSAPACTRSLAPGPAARPAAKPAGSTPGRCARCATGRQLHELLGDGPAKSARAFAPSTRRSRAPSGPAPCGLAGQEHGSADLAGARRRRAAAHPRRPRRAARRQAARAPAQRSWSPSGRCPAAMSRWPGWKPGSPGPPPGALIPVSAPAAPATPSGTCCAGSAPAAGEHTTHGQALAAQRNIKAAIALLDWLTARGLTLEAARQGDLDTWMGQAQARSPHRRRATSSAGHAGTS